MKIMSFEVTHAHLKITQHFHQRQGTSQVELPFKAHHALFLVVGNVVENKDQGGFCLCHKGRKDLMDHLIAGGRPLAFTVGWLYVVLSSIQLSAASSCRDSGTSTRTPRRTQRIPAPTRRSSCPTTPWTRAPSTPSAAPPSSSTSCGGSPPTSSRPPSIRSRLNSRRRRHE